MKDKEKYVEYPIVNRIDMEEMQKVDAEIKQRRAELAREFPFKKRGFRKHVR